MRNRRQRKRPIAEINVVPYIDVMLVLLVIFMITAQLINQGVKVDLPKASAQALSTKEKEPLIVSIDAQGNYFLNVAQNPQQPLEAANLFDQVSNELKASVNDPTPRIVLVKGDKNVDYGKVIAAMVLLQQAGAPSVGLMTDPQEPKS